MNNSKKIKSTIIQNRKVTTTKIFKNTKRYVFKTLYFLGINYRYAILLLLLFALYYILVNNIDHILFSKKEVLSLLISISSIIAAILITYIFGKLFSDKATRVDIKKNIDNLAVVINNFRNLVFRLRNIDSLWKVGKTSVNYIIRQKYPALTVNSYRNHLTYDEFVIVEKNINYMMGQTYLAMKGFADGDEKFTDYCDTNYRNFTLNDIERYIENSQYIWGYLDEASDATFSGVIIPPHWYDRLGEYYFNITGQTLNRDTFKNQIKDLMTYMQESVFQKHYYYNSLLQQSVPKFYVGLLINILILLSIVVVALVTFIIDFISGEIVKYRYDVTTERIVLR